MYNEINLDKMKKCSQCPFTCKGQIYCTRDDTNIDYNIKTVGSINELQEEHNGKTK